MKDTPFLSLIASAMIAGIAILGGMPIWATPIVVGFFYYFGCVSILLENKPKAKK